jgi:hypothetical protein
VIALGHIGGVPAEEFLPWLLGPGAGLAMARAWIAVGLHRSGGRDR